MRWVPAMLMIALLLVACAPKGPSSPLPSPRPTPGAPAEPEGVLIVHEISGGIAGIHEIWRFYGDGRVVREDRLKRIPSVRARLPAEEIEKAARHMIETGFLELADEYMPADPCCDRFTHRLTLIYKGWSKTVTTMSGAEMPWALEEALRVVNELIQRVGPIPSPGQGSTPVLPST